MIDINQVQRDFDNGVMLCRETIRQVIELAGKQAAKDGWQLVPVEPTLDMLDEAAQAMSRNGAEGNVLELQADAHCAYAAMLSVAASHASKDSSCG